MKYKDTTKQRNLLFNAISFLEASDDHLFEATRQSNYNEETKERYFKSHEITKNNAIQRLEEALKLLKQS